MLKQLIKRVLTGVVYLTVFFYSSKFHGFWFGMTIATVLVIELLMAIRKSDASLKTKLIICVFGLLYTVSGLHFLQTKGLFMLILTASLVDISAYVAGRVIGGPKLCSISPNKTVAGFIGGIVIFIPLKYMLIFRNNPMMGLKVFALSFVNCESMLLVVYYMLISLSAQLGDLLISYAKRKLNIKDSASWLPGHGGLWDRFDSVFGIISFLNIAYFAIRIFKFIG